ncbi:MAG: porin family protein [Bacteroidales bacterium]|nr:porin family protein [Bacteroidales bacterium]
MKRFILVILLLIPIIGFSQEKKPKNNSNYDKKTLHYGFTLGLNAMDFITYPSSSAYMPDSLFPQVTPLHPGFNINVVTSLRLTDYLNLRFLPGISFGQRTIYFYENQVNTEGEINRVLVSTDQKLESSFLEFPLLLKYKSRRVNNWRPYLIAGVNLRVDLSAKKEYDDDKDIYLRLNRTDLYYEVGFGVDFFLKYFKFSPEIKLSVGTRDILAHDPHERYPQYVNAIDRLKSMIWILNFHFE